MSFRRSWLRQTGRRQSWLLWLLLLLLVVVLVMAWQAGFHTLVCTSSVRLSLQQVQSVEPVYPHGPSFTHANTSRFFVSSPIHEEARLNNPRREEASHKTRPCFYSGVGLNQTTHSYTFRANDPLEDGQLILDSDYFQPRKTVVNPLMTDFIIDPGEALCNGPEGPPYLLIMIPSLTSHTASRTTIRTTWGSVVNKRNSWPRASSLHPLVKLVFVFGKSGAKDERRVLENESESFGDVLLVDFVDSYSNLTYKSLSSLRWAATRCGRATFVMKVDEDTFVNVPYLLEYLFFHNNKTLSGVILGHANLKPVTVRTGKWAVDLESYPLAVFPRYVYGHSYVISSDVIAHLVNVSQYLPYVPIEDAMVTGILGRALHVTRLHNPMFATVAQTPHTCLLVKNTVLTVTGIAVNTHRTIWDALKSGQCSYRSLRPGGNKKKGVPVVDHKHLRR